MGINWLAEYYLECARAARRYPLPARGETGSERNIARMMVMARIQHEARARIEARIARRVRRGTRRAA